MVRITRVYTRKGDDGKTSLVGKERFSKNSLRIETIGELDELNACIGFAIAVVPKELVNMKQKLQRIQNELFELGAQLTKTNEKTLHIFKKDIEQLENEMDEMNSNLSILNSFVLPGGHELSARLHLARTVCRRAERSMTRLMEKESLSGNELPYLNRLSDWLFVSARFTNHILESEEPLWIPREK